MIVFLSWPVHSSVWLAPRVKDHPTHPTETFVQLQQRNQTQIRHNIINIVELAVDSLLSVIKGPLVCSEKVISFQTIMFSLKFLFTFLYLISALTSVFADDIAIGMEGLRQAGSDPAMLAQLMQDMQDPELMAEAKKMMDSPEFQKQMKKLSQSKEFKETTKQFQQQMNDPNHAAQMEAKMEHMMKVGQEQLKKNAMQGVEGAMAAMNDPAVVAEMTKMLKDPNFAKQLKEMQNSPEFQNYMSAVRFVR